MSQLSMICHHPFAFKIKKKITILTIPIIPYHSNLRKKKKHRHLQSQNQTEIALTHPTIKWKLPSPIQQLNRNYHLPSQK